MKPEITDSALYSEYLEQLNMAKSSIQQYAGVIMKFLEDERNLLDEEEYKKFIHDHASKKCRSYYYYNAIKHYIAFKIDETKDEKIKRKLTKISESLIRPKFPDPVKMTRYLSIKEREAVINEIKEYKHRIIATIQNKTGLRAGDIIRLKKANIKEDVIDQELILMIQFNTKGERSIVRPIFDHELIRMIKDWTENHNYDQTYVFINRDKSNQWSQDHTIFRTNYVWYWRDLSQALHKLGYDYKDFSTHDFRRCFSRDVYVKNGKDIHLLQQILDHADIKSTVRYLRTSGLNTMDVYKEMQEEK